MYFIMKNKLIISTLSFLLLVILTLSNFDCKKDINQQNHTCPQGQHWDELQQTCINDSILPVDTTTTLLNDTTILVDSLSVISLSENYVTIDATKFSKMPTIGCIIIAPPCENAPFGFMRKVTSVSGTKSTLKCKTEFCGLNEAFKQLNFKYVQTDTFASTIVGKGATLSYKFSNKVLAPGLVFSGIIKMHIPSVELDYKRKTGSVLPQHVFIKALLNTEGSSLEITNSTESNIQLLKADTLGTFYLPTIEVPIAIPTPLGVIIIPLPFQQQINFTTYPFTVKGKATFKLTPVINCILGAEYTEGNWKNISSMSIQSADASQFCKNNFSANLSAISEYTIFNPIYSIAPYNSDLLKAYFEVPNKLSFNVQSNSPNYSLDYSLDMSGGIKTKLWDGFENNFSIGLNLIKENLAAGDWVSCGDTLTLTTKEVSEITETSAISGGNITNDGGSSITERGVCCSTSHNPTTSNNKTNDGSGNGSFISNITNLNANTTYYVRAFATNSSGTGYGNEISFNTTRQKGLDNTTWIGYYTETNDGNPPGTHFFVKLILHVSSGGVLKGDWYNAIPITNPNPTTYTNVTWTYFGSANSRNTQINWTNSNVSTGSFTFPDGAWTISGNSLNGKSTYKYSNPNDIVATYFLSKQ